MACLLFVFSYGRLAVPRQDIDLKARHVLFRADGVVLKGSGAKNGGILE